MRERFVGAVARRGYAAILLGLIAGAGSTGCKTLGPQTIRGDRFNYNEAGSQSSKEQILLNLVRLRYGEPMYFLEIGSMLSQFSFQATGALSHWENDIHGAYGPALRAAYGLRGDPSEQTTAAGNLQYSDTPTITYRPVQGEEFTKRVMAPIPPTVLIYLAHSGWSIDRLLACCVQQINNIPNRQLNDTDESLAPDTRKFARLIALMKKLQDTGRALFAIETDRGVSTTVLYIPSTVPGVESELREVRELLGYPPEGDLRLRVTGNAVRQAPDELAMETRSMLAAMYALSQECVVPPEHLTEGEVLPQREGEEGVLASKWMQVQHSRMPQLDPYVQVYYNGYWFYIPKNDWSTKRTFALLTYLFSLQAADMTMGQPVVTIPTGK